MSAKSIVHAAIALQTFLLCGTAFAEEDGGSESEITVTAPKFENRVSTPVIVVEDEDIRFRGFASAADIVRGLPGASLRPNSRGEVIVRIRGAEERQTRIFLDGAPIAVPWDGRVDLGVVSAGLIGRATIVKGAVPSEYGVNAVAGVLDLESRKAAPGFNVQAEGELGLLGYGNTSGIFSYGSDRFGVIFAGGYQTREAETIADADALPFSQPSRKRRTNTDLDSKSLFAAMHFGNDDIEARISLLHNDATKGVAPESDRDPALANPRFWRYPELDLTQLTGSVAVNLGDIANLKTVVWHQWFNQTIDAYRSVTFAALRTRQQDDDNTIGVRSTLYLNPGPIGFRLNASAQTSTHKQIDTPFPSAVPGPELTFRQHQYSIGGEFDVSLGDATKATLSGGYDWSETPLTGDKPRQPSVGAPAFSLGLQQRFSDKLSLTASAGRRTRFPALRELFGEALGRFTPNPDLQPETVWLADLDLAYTDEAFKLSLNPFLMRSKNTLAQRVLAGGRRQRFNLPGAWSYGVDASAEFMPSPQVTLSLNASLLRAKADEESALPFRRLVQRPSHEIGLGADYQNTAKTFRLFAEVRHIGNAVDLDAFGAQAKLPSAFEANARAEAKLFSLSGDKQLFLTLGVDNAFNATIFPQAGLPLPGRQVRIGFRVR
jgi:iron complex outermembrane recepter protein